MRIRRGIEKGKKRGTKSNIKKKMKQSKTIPSVNKVERSKNFIATYRDMSQLKDAISFLEASEHVQKRRWRVQINESSRQVILSGNEQFYARNLSSSPVKWSRIVGRVGKRIDVTGFKIYAANNDVNALEKIGDSDADQPAGMGSVSNSHSECALII